MQDARRAMLEHLPSTEGSMPPTAYSIGQDAFDYILRMAVERKATRILELGSGWSTLRLREELPGIAITSIESHTKYLENTRTLLNEHGVADVVDLRHCPLRPWWYGSRRFLTYDLDLGNEAYDFVLIDGPPYWTRMGREAVLYKIFGQLPVGAAVVLDDARRSHERRARRQWKRVYGDAIRDELVDVGHGLLIVTKVAEVEHPRKYDFRATFETIFVYGRAWAGRVKRSLNGDPRIPGTAE